MADGNRSGARGTTAAKGNMRAEHLKHSASSQPEPQTRVIGRARVCGDGVTRGSGEPRPLARCHHPCPTTEFPPAALPRHFACCELIALRILRLDSPSRWVCLSSFPESSGEFLATVGNGCSYLHAEYPKYWEPLFARPLSVGMAYRSETAVWIASEPLTKMQGYHEEWLYHLAFDPLGPGSRRWVSSSRRLFFHHMPDPFEF